LAIGANLNTSAFDGKGRIWFTGQSGVFGRLDPKTGDMKVWDAPRGTGPYGITATPDGQIWYVSLAGSYLGRPDLDSGEVSVIDPPKKASGPRRVWSDSKWASVGQRMERRHSQRLRPPTKGWQTWALPGESAHAYAVYVDDENKVWVSDFATNAILRFDPMTEKFESFPSTRDSANVRQMAGRRGEAWGAESGTDRLVVIRYGRPPQ
jgi:virginiamycin B lyase